MRQARTVLSTYSADTFGVCSALYELGGMIVMHDASGCNSTYSTHDEPRWYHSNSLVFISGLTEMEAIMGDDQKVVSDMLEAIRELHPNFAALVGTPIPVMTGCDFPSLAAELERKSGIPCFGFATNGMASYVSGVSEALAAFALRMTDKDVKKRKKTVNILGATPLDFSINSTVESMRSILQERGWEVLGIWAMGSTLEQLRRAGEASVNLVVTGSGIKAAQLLQKQFGTPYVVGTMIGEKLTEQILLALERTEEDGKTRIAFAEAARKPSEEFLILGESVLSRSLAHAIYLERGLLPKVIYPMEALPELKNVLTEEDLVLLEEDEIKQACSQARCMIADPLYRPILSDSCKLISLPHEAFSGRIARRDIPDLTKLSIQAFLEVE
ncbi:MAG: oxidoreductase [Clostridia bacterium]|nr:oxidoreductase [Clostridia bacterium]